MNDSARKAAGSSFYAGMRILPADKRAAMYDVYAFCRIVDDIADGDAGVADPQAEMNAWRKDVQALYGGADAGRAAFLAPHVARYGLRSEDFLAVIDGMEMDLHGPVVAPSHATLDLYCDRVASAVGRLSTPIFGLQRAEGEPLAYHLGRALQLTNILRDLDEDAQNGRLYLPREALANAGMADFSPRAVLAHPALATACRSVVAEAREHFEQARAIMDRAPRAAVKAPRLMASAYADVLQRLERRGFAPPRRRVGVNKLRLVGAALRWAFV
ncbi:MAG: presqualene diphosphate synthase HpnD [Hyphomicrobiales bacterium]|nr:presqualene diphosphate synthase HpnD [Hyphomicrobiales bacterium]